ncbi:MAG: hypothetical protein A2V70_18400 [Planctomycetes bacterium RBG_13_63_9]|nr:MAG: hypothetical protein A2V70_18400 [Planctomycetes bacterium RBG_13_63_9]
MSDFEKQDELTQALRTAQIITGALVAGCVFFLVIALVMVNQGLGAAAQAGPTVITYVALAFTVVVVLARLIVLNKMAAAGRQQLGRNVGPTETQSSDGIPAPGNLTRLYFTRMVVSGALIEGPAFFLLISYLVEQTSASLIAAILMIIALAFQMPTRTRMREWIESQRTQAEQEHQLGR